MMTEILLAKEGVFSSPPSSIRLRVGDCVLVKDGDIFKLMGSPSQ